MFYICCVCLYVHLVSFITALIDLYVSPCVFLHFLHFFIITSLLRRKPRYIFSFLFFAAIKLMFLIISMVSSNLFFIFNFWHFCSLFIIIFWIILFFFNSKISKLFGGWVCVVGSSHFLCLSTHI